MAKKGSKNKPASNTIVQNKKARHDFFIEDTFEAGLVLEGWEVKSLRAGRVNLVDSYVILKSGEAWLFGAHMSPLPTVSTHFVPDPIRTRKLLLNRRELGQIHGAIQAQGYTCVPLALYWIRGRVKCQIGLAKGKQKFDKRATQKEKDWNREKARVLRTNNR